MLGGQQAAAAGGAAAAVCLSNFCRRFWDVRRVHVIISRVHVYKMKRQRTRIRLQGRISVLTMKNQLQHSIV